MNAPDRILIVDDNPGDARLVAEVVKEIRDWQPEVRSVATRREAEVDIDRFLPDVVLIDFNLGETTGPDVILALRNKGFIGPAIILTGAGDVQTAATSFRGGAADFLPKCSVTPSSLRSSISDAIHQSRLEVEISQNRRRIEAANVDLMRRNAEINQFYNQMSHELRTPLTATREFLSMTLDGVAGPLNDEQVEMLKVARSSCDQITAHLNDLIDATQIETGRLRIAPIIVEVTSFLKSIVGALAPQAARKQIVLTLQAEQDLGFMEVDPDRFVQIINNLVGNAIKFTDARGEIVVEAIGRGDHVEFHVRDSGCGIEQAELERIFDRLYQVQSDDPSAGQDGLGLGLFFCREIVALHHGKISVTSRVGIGSTFTVTLPLAKLELAPSSPSRSN